MSYDLLFHLRRQIAWSEQTFGPGERTASLLDHIRKELLEIEANPQDLEEWIDVVMLAFDGAWRSGHSADEVVIGLVTKLEKNRRRIWPDWRQAPKDRAIEHVRSTAQPLLWAGPRGTCAICGTLLVQSGSLPMCATCASPEDEDNDWGA